MCVCVYVTVTVLVCVLKLVGSFKNSYDEALDSYIVDAKILN